ncbi:MAG: hypothetical protein KDD64_03580 [Bdellovibrionales bacterium]|nr:hypothetical protein [Bdellovibrionales bacterium]
MKKLVQFCILTFCCLLSFSTTAFGQFETELGTLNSTGQSFSCIDQAGSPIKILITLSSGKEKLLSKKKAKRTVLGIQRALNKKISKINKIKKKKQRKIEKLLKSISLIPDFNKSEKIAKLREDIEKLDVRLAVLSGDRDFATVLKDQVIDCEAQEIGNGRNISVLQNGNSPFYGSSYFVLTAVHAFQYNYQKNGPSVCAEIDGTVQKVNVTTSRCADLQDRKPGNPAGSSFRVCYNLPPSTANASIILRFGYGYYHDSGWFDHVSELVNEALAQEVRVYLPDKNGQC